MTSSKIEAVFPAVLSELHNMLNFIKKSAEFHDLQKDKMLKMELACEELLVNIISYAYQGSPGNISISCLGSAEILEVVIKDSGFSFNPFTAVIDLQENLSLRERQLGGLGIFLAKNSVDEFSYERQGKYNVVSLKIRNT
ncbi:histidine kinase-like ATPase domain protein [Chlamydia ibidis]|uniref:Histidine kinase-like ATPase domain protein n=2 Tax=Chlamydia ibidis TaxID=1405396 RepID=S7J3S0_9CHLA|nr:anti-sigma regulatory factor [Chlamydia ibidis]EPP34662.1 histidine kinase-like ATPase domain protein [Chlamydia ibidis]EQM63032.1 regulator of sigma subunit-histidine kinase [Chlamydia ibidis 10-1398/6]